MAEGFFERWFNRASNAVTFWTVVPSGILGVLSAYFASGTEWINQFGAWGWLTAGIAAFLASSIAFGVIARTKLWRVEAKRAALLAGDSSPFDPMAPTYENKRLYLRDLAPAGRRFVQGRTFLNCEIVGPGTIVLFIRSSEHKPWPSMSESHMIDSDVVQVAPDAVSALAVGFPDCNFHGCKFFHMTLLFYDRKETTDWNWITPDFRQPTLIEAQASDRPE